MTDLHHPDPIAQALRPEVPGDFTSSTMLGGWFVFGVVLAIMLIDGALLELWREGYGAVLVREYGVVESFQTVLVAIACAVFWLSWREGSGAPRIAGCALTFLAAAIFVRELDVKKFNGPDWYNWISHRGLQEILLVAMTVPIIFYLLRHWRQWLGLLRLGLKPAALPLYISGACILTGAYFDARIHGWIGKVFWEEFIELNGYLFLVLAACLHLKIVRTAMDGAG